MLTGIHEMPEEYGIVLHEWHSKIATPNDGMLEYPQAFDLYEQAHTALRLRYEACVLAEQSFRKSYLAKDSLFHQQEQLDVQNHALYSFFNNSYSFFDSFSYMMFMLGLVLEREAPAFDKEEREITVFSTKQAFEKHFPDDGITAVLTKTVDDPEYKFIREFRNVVSHRLTSDRISRINDQQHTEYVRVAGKNEDRPLDINETTLDTYLNWLRIKRNDLLFHYGRFVKDNFPDEPAPW
jgi:hypothetical protein